MSRINSFEDLKCWTKSRALCSSVFVLINKEAFSRDWKLRDQINASSGSVMDNIAEGFERGSTREFVSFLGYAKGSAAEVKSQLYRAHDRGYISDEELSETQALTDECSKMIRGMIKYLNSTEVRGDRFNSTSREHEEHYESSSEALVAVLNKLEQSST